MPAVHRRDFLAATSAGAAGALTLPAAVYGRVLGANERIGVAFLGTGLRCNDHITVVNRIKAEKKSVELVGVCDVWDGNDQIRRGLYYSAQRCGLDPADQKHVTKDYRRLLDLPEVDVVCIATPDHWHAKMAIDAAAAGKDVFCEKPMTRTIDEAHAVVDAMQKHQRVMTVGVQSMADPTWMRAYDLIKAGKIGHVAQAQTSYYRNSIAGQWRTYKLTPDMNPKTVDWDLFLGHQFSVMPGVPLAPQVPFDRAIYGQWRCYWPFGGGMFTDLFVHQTTHLIAAMGVRYPARVVGAGGIFLEYDGRDVPDVATVVADYDEGCQLIITATMINRYPIEEVIRGRLGTIKFVKGGFEIIADNPSGGPGMPPRLEDRIRGEFVDCKPPQGPHADTHALWENFLECCRSRSRETLSTPELGAAAFTTVMLGVHSYREGHVFLWDKERRKMLPGNGSWSEGWEKRSQARGKPNNIIGWEAGETGNTFVPPDYMKLAGPWVDGRDPAGS
ncbi:MAG TPA: Gfo/Idh/MocA family oxidoreductase [Gemmatales bacterium]|mgnify:FL=1|nr:Gfo/Idh/MocA family oxidoreductase [Gemmatales bacterium]